MSFYHFCNCETSRSSVSMCLTDGCDFKAQVHERLIPLNAGTFALNEPKSLQSCRSHDGEPRRHPVRHIVTCNLSWSEGLTCLWAFISSISFLLCSLQPVTWFNNNNSSGPTEHLSLFCSQTCCNCFTKVNVCLTTASVQLQSILDWFLCLCFPEPALA